MLSKAISTWPSYYRTAETVTVAAIEAGAPILVEALDFIADF
jgi:hypothetical protein